MKNGFKAYETVQTMKASSREAQHMEQQKATLTV
jgi:hypothetical protein